MISVHKRAVKLLKKAKKHYELYVEVYKKDNNKEMEEDCKSNLECTNYLLDLCSEKEKQE